MVDPTSEDQAFSTLDAEKIKQDAVEAAQKALISKLQGDKPKYAWQEKGLSEPKTYDDLFDETDRKYVRKEEVNKYAEEVVEKKLQEKEEQQLKAQEESRKQQYQSIEESRKKFDSEWYQLVQEKKMPAPSAEVQEKINKGEKLTKDEIMADEGLKARLELAQLATNKSAKLAYYEDYQSKQPAGASAPVLGGRPSTPQMQSQDYDYAEIQQNRKKLFGF